MSQQLSRLSQAIIDRTITMILYSDIQWEIEDQIKTNNFNAHSFSILREHQGIMGQRLGRLRKYNHTLRAMWLKTKTETTILKGY